ncbi:MAG: MotA/TolQ/ExbB proton channel family protein [Planctomycetes bacterium]|nr:MotA/TolQ/ExbB proton channel family protein [Planctomycetota bacterium]
MMDLPTILLQLSNALLYPVIGALTLLLIWVVVGIGGFAREGWARRRHRRSWRDQVRRAVIDPDLRFMVAELTPPSGIPARALSHPGAHRAKTLDDLELESERALDRMLIGLRLGPLLGLAGTLIPLGPALMALSDGDLAALSSRLVVAFTTTVIGLVIGALSFVMHTVRRQWYVQDLADAEFLLERIDP